MQAGKGVVLDRFDQAWGIEEMEDFDMFVVGEELHVWE